MWSKSKYKAVRAASRGRNDEGLIRDGRCIEPLTRFTRKVLLQLRQMIDRGLRQRTLQYCAERIFELLRCRDADENRAHRGMRDAKAHRCFGDACGKSVLDQRRQTLRAPEVALIALRRADRRWRRTGDRVTPGGSRQ